MAMVIKPKRKFGDGAPTTSDLAVGEIAISTGEKKLYIRDDQGAIIEIGGAAGTTSEITQSTHGFIVKDAIYHDGSDWEKAQANSVNTLALGIVTEATTNTFVVAQSGRFELTSHGLTVGQWYYLSAAAAGGLVTTEPTISQPIVYVEDANNIFIFAYRPTNLLINGGSSVITGDNTVSTIKIQDDAVTYGKMQNVSATDRILGRDTAGAGIIEEISPANVRTMLNVEDGSTADQTGAQIKTAYEAESNAFTDAQFTKLAGIETSATADQTGAQIKTAYEAQSNAFTDAQFTKLAGVATSANNYVHPNHSGEVTSTADGATVIASDIVDEDNLKISNAGTNGQVLTKQSGDTGGLTWATVGGAYSDWSIISGAENLAAKGQYICDNASAATHVLPAASAPGNVGDTVIICNAGAGLVTLNRNSSNINSAGEDGTLPQGSSVQLVYVSDAIGWFEV